MDLQKMINNSMKAMRKDSFDKSAQLTLGELILKLELIKDKSKQVYFDDTDYKPTGFGSWRGSYCELYIGYDGSGEEAYELPKEDCEKDELGDHSYDCKCGGLKGVSTILPENPTVQDVLDMLKLIKNKMFVGYKGGDFEMTKNTPVWVASYGDSSGFKTNEDFNNQAVVDVVEGGRVEIRTELIEY